MLVCRQLHHPSREGKRVMHSFFGWQHLADSLQLRAASVIYYLFGSYYGNTFSIYSHFCIFSQSLFSFFTLPPPSLCLFAIITCLVSFLGTAYVNLKMSFLFQRDFVYLFSRSGWDKMSKSFYQEVIAGLNHVLLSSEHYFEFLIQFFMNETACSVWLKYQKVLPMATLYKVGCPVFMWGKLLA